MLEKCNFCHKTALIGNYAELVKGFNTLIKVVLCETCLNNLRIGINKCIGSVSNEKINNTISIIRRSDMDRIGDELQKYINEAENNDKA